MAVSFSFHNKLNILVDTIRVTEEPFQLFWHLRLDHKRIILHSKSSREDCGLLISVISPEVLHVEVGDYGRKW